MLKKKKKKSKQIFKYVKKKKKKKANTFSSTEALNLEYFTPVPKISVFI